MEKIDNEYLEREFNNNYENNEIFKRQRHSTLDLLEKKIKENNEILLEININNIMPFYKLRSNFKDDENEEEKYWNHVISILFNGQLKDKYNIYTNHDVELEKRIMTRDNIDYYKKTEDCLLNRNDVIEIIKNICVKNSRIHVLLKYVNNDNIWKEIINYLNCDSSLITMIYSDSELPMESNFNNVIIFDQYEEGIEYNDIKCKSLTYEKKI